MRLVVLGRALFLALLSSCAPTTQDPVAPAPSAKESTVAAIVAPAQAVDRVSSLDHMHGNWRVVAEDDPGDQAIMAVTLLSTGDAASANGDYVLFQPACDVVDDRPISGASNCELIGQAGAFERIELRDDRACRPSAPPRMTQSTGWNCSWMAMHWRAITWRKRTAFAVPCAPPEYPMTDRDASRSCPLSPHRDVTAAVGRSTRIRL